MIWHGPGDIPDSFQGAVVTVGIFDGVHKGHKAIVHAAVRRAQAMGLPAVALTFDPHPSVVHRPDVPVHLVTSLEDRLQRLESAGLWATYVQHYDATYAQLTAADFVRQQLLGQLQARAVVVGEDVRFGAGNEGDSAMLRALGERYGFAVQIVPDVLAPEGRRWSSTWVRELLAAGDVAGAARVLGRPHRVRGTVQRGFHRGRKLGFPTANLAGEGLGEVPRDGVYAGWVVVQVPGTQAAEYLPAAISVGTNPQFDGTERTVEAHVLGRSDLNLYGQEIAVDFMEYLRPMMKLRSVEELLTQMDDDLRAVAEVLAVPVPSRIAPEAVTAC